MKDNTVLILAGAAVLLLVMKKKAAAATVPTTGTAVTSNVQNQMWQSILGPAWKALLAPSSTGAGSGFLMTNNWGQVVTSDGKPVDSTLPAISSALSNSDYSGGYTGVSDPVSTAAPDGTDWLSTLGW
jgi:hypothetical protein